MQYDILSIPQAARLQTALNMQKMYAPAATPIQKSESDENDLIKGGEGSKGGKVIGHTKSGKPIYAHFDHEGHKDFSKEDHGDAIKAHMKTMRGMFDKRYKKTNNKAGGILIGGEGSTVEDYQHHEDQAFKHTEAR